MFLSFEWWIKLPEGSGTAAMLKPTFRRDIQFGITSIYPCGTEVVTLKLLHVSADNLNVISTCTDYKTAFRANKAINSLINFENGFNNFFTI